MIPSFAAPVGNFTPPANHRGTTETSPINLAFDGVKKRLSALGPGKSLGTGIGGERDDDAIVQPVAFRVLHERADVVVELGHAGCFNGRAVLPITHGTYAFMYRQGALTGSGAPPLNEQQVNQKINMLVNYVKSIQVQ
jgi:hypothetical protein